MAKTEAPEGWHYDEVTGALMRDVIHRMGRRCRNWDYCGRGTYQITITLADRRARLLGELRYDAARGAYVAPSALGRAIEGFIARMGELTPEIEVLAAQLMPDHLHLIVRVNRRMGKPVGYAIRGLKGAATKAYWATLGFSAEAQRPGMAGGDSGTARGGVGTARGGIGSVGDGVGLACGGVGVAGGGVGSAGGGVGSARGGIGSACGGIGSARGGVGLACGGMGLAGDGVGVARGGVGLARSGSAIAPGLKSPGPLFAEGYVDTIIFSPGALARERAYLADNPRRLYEKLAHPELFAVVRDLAVDLGGGLTGHFAAIGNHHLLKAGSILQVQCSRRFFAYARDAAGALVKDAPPRVSTGAFREMCEALLEEAAHGAVLISPCISEGEREIARRAYRAGYPVITLANKGFSPLYKPGGRQFDHCAAGRLLMLAPAAWPYLPGEKRMTRLDACVLNRLAQLLAGPGAVEIVYAGKVLAEVEAATRAAVRAL